MPGVSSVSESSTSRAWSRASAAGGYSGRGTAMTARPAAAAERSPFEESSTAAHAAGATPRRPVASR